MVSVDGKASQAMNSKLHKAFIVLLNVFTLLLIFPVVSVQAHIPKDTHDQFLSRNCSSFAGVTGNVAGARTASRNTSFLTRKHRIRQEATTARIGRDADKTLSGNTLNVGNKSTVDIDRITSASRKTAKRSTFTHTPGPRPQFNTDGLTEIQLAKLAKRRPDLLPQGFTPKPRALLPEATTPRKIPNSQLTKPSKRGNAPIGSDDHPIELHHRNQTPDSPLDEMTRTEHRGKGNFKKNHSNIGQQASKIDRKAWKKKQSNYWKNEWDSGRFDD